MNGQRAMTAASKTKRQKGGAETAVRERILAAAFAAFVKSGLRNGPHAGDRDARVSKRELYALVGNKQEILIACIRERAKRLQVPTNLPCRAIAKPWRRLLARCEVRPRGKRSRGYCSIPAGRSPRRFRHPKWHVR
jgi:AcrR family transcriptional regulator